MLANFLPYNLDPRIKSKKYTSDKSFTLGFTEAVDNVNILQSCNEPDYAHDDSNFYGCAGLRLAFDPTKSPDYKVVRTESNSVIFIKSDTSCDDKPFQATSDESFDHNLIEATSDKSSDHNLFQATFNESSYYNPFQATSDESSNHNPFEASSNDTLKSSSDDTCSSDSTWE
nr:hypothetical protein [Tanacetum cinerariifolium]